MFCFFLSEFIVGNLFSCFVALVRLSGVMLNGNSDHGISIAFSWSYWGSFKCFLLSMMIAVCSATHRQLKKISLGFIKIMSGCQILSCSWHLFTKMVIRLFFFNV